jgi:hypothetical protein
MEGAQPMTENETLRALLKEARETVKTYRDMMLDCEDPYHTDLCACGAAARNSDLLDRIDEALAEPETETVYDVQFRGFVTRRKQP